MNYLKLMPLLSLLWTLNAFSEIDLGNGPRTYSDSERIGFFRSSIKELDDKIDALEKKIKQKSGTKWVCSVLCAVSGNEFGNIYLHMGVGETQDSAIKNASAQCSDSVININRKDNSLGLEVSSSGSAPACVQMN